MAADAPRPSAGADGSSLAVEQLKPGLYRLNGAGGGTVLRVGATAAVVVDASRAGTFRSLKAEIDRVANASRVPIGAVVLTGVGPDQAGNIAKFADAGVPVIVQRRALVRLAGDDRPGAVAATSVVAYDDDYVLRVGGIEAEIEHVGRGRSGADSVVLFRDLRVLAVGELFTDSVPQPDCASGGSFAGWAAAIDHLMWLDFELVVPSRGAPVSKRELLALKAKLESLAARAGPAPAGQPDCRPAP